MPRTAFLSPENRKKVLDALGEAQRIGMLGDAPLEQVVDRSLAFVRALPLEARTVIDLGSGGGDPGLVIAVAEPDLLVTLVDRRQKRTDLLSRLVGRLGVQDRVEVVTSDVVELGQRLPGRFWDAATSRSFGPPEYTASHASALLQPGGVLLVSEPPASDGSRWENPEFRNGGFRLTELVDGVAVLVRI
jgi:16S rRNA (guanine527-N7)-methyltransferase